MDCNMPVMDGLEATRFIRQNPSYDDITVAVLTSYTEGSFREDCLKAGMNLFLTKPVSNDAIDAILRDLSFI